MGDYVYSFSAGGATVHRTADLEMIVELELPGNEPIGYQVFIEEEPDRVGTAESSEGDETCPDGTESCEVESDTT